MSREVKQDDDMLIRYACENNTLRKYLYINQDDNSIVDFLKIIRGSGDTTYTSFYEENKQLITSKVEKDELKLVDDIIKFWVAYNNFFSDELLDDILPLQVEEINNVHNKDIVSSDDIRDFYIKKDTYIKRLQEEIAEVKIRHEKRSESKVDFASIHVKPFSDIDIQSVSMTFVLKVSELSLSELFNDIILNNETPFVYYKNFFKILKSFKVDENWNEESVKDEIILYVKDKVSEESYTKVIIDENFKVSFDLITKKGYVTSEKFIKNIVGVLNISEDSIQDVTEEELSSFFVYENSRINSYIFTDLAMNDKLFSTFISIDESVKTTKKYTSSGEPWVYIHFNDETTGYITAGITQRAPDDDYTQPYLKINCKGKDRNGVEKFQNIFGKLLSLYEAEKDNIIKQYKEFIENFTDEKQFERKISRKTMGKVLNAEDVKDPNEISGYSRQCQKKFRDNLVKIDEKEYSELPKNRAIQFPRSKGVGEIEYQSDGRNISYYKCKDGMYPGIQNNITGNFQKYFPYLPCCFKKDQTGVNIFQHYYSGVPLEEKGKQQELIKTEKILEYDNFGKLPETVENLFKIIDPESQYTYFRFGMDRNTGSFISCILTAILDKEYTRESNEKNKKLLLSARASKINTLRQYFSGEDILPLCKQCTYDISDTDLVKTIQDNKIYFDPRMFIQLLEEHFDLNIIIFNKDGIVKPYYSQKYYHNFKTGKKFIFVYENWGSERDRAEYPQCELIIRWRKDTQKTLYLFDDDEQVSQNVKNIFSDLIQSYILSNENQSTNYNEYFQNKSIVINSQNIDSYGKTRQLIVEYGDNVVTILTSPIQPLKTIIGNNYIYKADVNTAKNIFGELEMKIVSQDDKKIKASNGSDVFTIFLGNTVVTKKSSTLSVYNQNKKIARYLSSYILWHFSNYLEENKIDSFDDDIVNDFSNEGIVIIENYEYKNIAKTFSKKSPVFDSDGKLVLTSIEMLKRLIYLLRLKISQNYRQVLLYNQNKVIPDYYIDLTDFDVYQNQTILQGGDCIYKWNSSLDNKVYIYDKVVVQNIQPYFFKNSKISDTIYLAQNTDSIDRALNITVTWNNEGYNIGYYAESENSLDYSYILYSYGNVDEIDKYEIEGKNKSSKPIQIIGYKIDDNDRFTVLLDIK